MSDPMQLPETGIEPRSLASQTHGYRPAVSPRFVGLLLAALSGALVAGSLMFFVGRASAAPRSAPSDSGPWTLLEAPLDPEVAQLAERRVPDLRYAEVAGSSPALGVNGGASLPSPPPTIGTRPASVGASPDLRTPPATSVKRGIASFMAPSYGSRYLALPEGPGVTVTICAKSRCITRTSTDAGPDLAMQRAGRVADISFADFKRLCGCDPYVVGLLRVTVDYGGPSVTPPATDR